MDTEVIAIITGVVLPFVSPLLYKAAWPEYVKFAIVIVLAAAVGALELYLAGEFGDLTWDTALAHLAIIYTVSAPVFWVVIDQTGLKPWLENHGVK